MIIRIQINHKRSPGSRHEIDSLGHSIIRLQRRRIPHESNLNAMRCSPPWIETGIGGIEAVAIDCLPT
jgi:hypothetical protein